MNQWVDVHVETIMNDTNAWDGRTIHGLAHYLNKIIAQNNKIIELLSNDTVKNDE